MARPLAEYKRKRNFGKTPEPQGKPSANGKQKLSFVVQEHHARNLHYDFRLEWDGVLKSWAVPKGPPTQPKEKRLAVQVEDHPLEYGKFEGEIPKGEYGAGQVIRWDKGTWVPLNDPAKGLKAGRLEFELRGQKLKGEWLLVRTRGSSSGKAQWLMIKRTKDVSSPQTRSVPKPTTRSKEKKTKAKANTSRVHLEFVPPQLAQLVDKPPSGRDWVHEIKYDGYRIQAHLSEGKVKLFTRNGLNWTDKYPVLVNELKDLDVEDAILDGEVIWQDEEGRSDFQALQNAMKAKQTDHLAYWVFDLLHLNGKSLRDLPLMVRKDRLEKLLRPQELALVRYSDHFREAGTQMFKAACDMRLEGVVSKRADRGYASGRSDIWVKSKCVSRQEFVIGGYTEGEGSRQGFGALLVGVTEHGKLRYAGKVGTGFSNQTLRQLQAKLKRLESKKSPFELASPKGKGLHWVKPQLLCEVSFAQWTRDKQLRAASFQGLRADKAPEEVTVETAKPLKKNSSAVKTAVVTHPDRVVFEKERLTKQDVANYYSEVALHMVPHLRDRPLSLLRCTSSSTKPCFFSKHFAEKFPEQLIEVPEAGKEPYFAIDDDRGLLTLVQYGSVEFHPWNCHRSNIEQPDQIVLDFDPDPGVTFKTVVEGALEMREILQQLGLKSFVKLTGGKGVHVQFPFVARYSWEAVKEFSKTLALEMVSRHPDLYTANMSKRVRKNKIFLDYLRNGRGATAIAAYSLRARPKSSVAMPVPWKELGKYVPDQFSLPEALKFLKLRRGDPWREYNSLHQKIALLEQ